MGRHAVSSGARRRLVQRALDDANREVQRKAWKDVWWLAGFIGAWVFGGLGAYALFLWWLGSGMTR